MDVKHRLGRALSRQEEMERQLAVRRGRGQTVRAEGEAGCAGGLSWCDYEYADEGCMVCQQVLYVAGHAYIP